MARIHIKIPGFKGGQADSLYDSRFKQTFQTARNLRVIGEENILTPLPVFSFVNPPSFGSNDFAPANVIFASDGNYYFIGDITDTSSKAVLYSTPNSIGVSPTWTQRVAIGSGLVSPALEEYERGVFYGRNQDLRRWGLDDSTDTTITTGLTTSLTFLRANKGTGLLHFIHDSGRAIGTYNNTDTATLNALTLERDDNAIGIEPYGMFNVIGNRGTNKEDSFLIWDGSATTLDDIITTKDRGLQAFKIQGSTIHYLVARTITGDNSIRYYQVGVGGGRPRLIKEFKLGTVTGTVDVNPNAIDFDGDIFNFAFGIASSSLLDQVIWAYGNGGSGFNDILVPHRTTSDGATTNKVFIVSKNFPSQRITVTRNLNNDRPYTIEATGISSNLSDDGVYQTNIFPLNDGLPGQIKRIYINHKPLPASTGFTVGVKLFGNYPWGGTVKADETVFTDLVTDQGSDTTTGITQSTENATFTEIATASNFEPARFAQLQIKLDMVSTTNAPEIIFGPEIPIDIEVETDITRP